jgi:cell division protein FtsW
VTVKERPSRQRQVSRAAALRIGLTAWLIRPLASFHLLLAVFGLLTAIGLVMVLSASAVVDIEKGSFSAVGKPLLFAAVGLGTFYLGLRLPLRKIRQLSPAFLLISIALLALVLTPLGRGVPGREHSWFIIGPMSFQPVEVAKVALALWGAHVLVTKRAMVSQYRHLLVPVVPVSLVLFTLVMLQPDLGSTVSMGLVLVALLWFVGAPMRLFAVFMTAALAAVAVLSVGADYRLQRVLQFLNPSADPTGAGHQLNQALYALADGGLFGKGLGQGPSKFNYLPNVQNDFIFALIGEELGFVGAVVVLGLFGMLAVVGLRIAARNTDPWIRLVTATLTVWLVGQAAINVGYVIGLLPVTGITLPLISAGGTSTVVTMMVFGVLANCARNEPDAVAALRSLGPGKVGGLLKLPAPEPYRQAAKRRPVRPSTPPRGRGSVGRGGGTGAAMPSPEDRRRVHRSAPPTEYRRRSAWRSGQDRSVRGPGGHGRTAEGGRR